MSDSKKLESQQTNIESSTGHTGSGDHNDFSGTVESGGIVLQGGEHKIEINQYFGPAAPAEKDPRDFVAKDFEPATIRIPEGPFIMGPALGPGADKYDSQEHEVKPFPEYYIGLKLITNAQYAVFVNAKRKVVPPVMRWRGQSVPDGLEDEPALGVTCSEALEYCEWLTGETRRQYSLPNEAQWEKACRGSYPCSEGMGRFLEWTCSLWGEKRNEPDLKYSYPWYKTPNRNDLQNRTDRRVVRGYILEDELTGLKRSCTRYGRSVNEYGSYTDSGDARYGFRVVLTF